MQFSNHTNYKYTKGQILTNKELAELVEGLQINGLDRYSHLLTGYIRSPGFLNEIVALYKHLKSINPDLIYGKDKE